MEPKALVYRTWDELVFEHRNKAYGAYALRRSYNDKVLLGFGVSVLMLAILFLLPTDGENKLKLPPVFDLSGTVKLEPPPILNVRPPAASLQQTVRTRRENTTPVITTAQVIEEPVDQTPAPTTSESGVDGNINSFSTTGAGAIGESEILAIPAPEPDFVMGAEIQPAYEGGFEAMMRFIKSKLRYPAAPRRLQIEGTVYVSFIVNGDGSLRDVEVLRGIHPDCDKEAARVIGMMPGWIGGKQAGRPVAVKMVLPIKFKLEK